MLSLLVLLSHSLNTYGGYVKSDNYRLQFLCNMTSDVKFLLMFFCLPFACSKATALYELK